VSNTTHAQVTCDAGYLLVGEGLLTCSNGDWNATPSYCELGKNKQYKNKEVFVCTVILYMYCSTDIKQS